MTAVHSWKCGDEEYVFKQWTRGAPLTRKVKQLAINVMVKYKELNPRQSMAELNSFCANLLGVGKASLVRTRTEMNRTGRTVTKGKLRPRCRGRYTRLRRYNKADLVSIRQIIHAHYLRQEYPTAKKIKRALSKRQDLPNFKAETFRLLMEDLNFTHAQRRRKYVLIDRADIVKWRRTYLRKIKAYRKDKRDIIYIDETFVSAEQKNEHSQLDRCVSDSTDAGMKDSKESSERNRSCIILHAGNESGLVPGCLSLFSQNETVVDIYLDEEYFENWFQKSLLPNIRPHSVIVLDNAPCNTIIQHQIPTISWTTDEIRMWLTGHGISWSEDLIKSELIGLVEGIREGICNYRVDILAREAGHDILRLPPYHGEFNPLMQVWDFVNEHIKKHIGNSALSDVQQLAKDAIERVTGPLWKIYFERIIREEDKMWKLDDLIDEMMDKVTIALEKNGASGVEVEAAIDTSSNEAFAISAGWKD